MRVRSIGHAGAVAGVAGAARPVELAGLDAEEAAEAEAFVGEAHRPVGIAFPGGDRVAEAGDQHVAHLDFADHPLGGAVRQHDVDGCGGRAALHDAQPHLLLAGAGKLSRLTRPVLERPHAIDGVGRRRGEDDADAMVGGRQIDFARAVAVAEFHQPAGAIDAQALDRVARPAAAVAFDREPLLGAEHAVVAPGRDVTLEIGLAAEQAKAVLHLPVDARLRTGRLRQRGGVRDERKQKGDKAQSGKTQDGSTHDGCRQHGGWGAHR